MINCKALSFRRLGLVDWWLIYLASKKTISNQYRRNQLAWKGPTVAWWRRPRETRRSWWWRTDEDSCCRHCCCYCWTSRSRWVYKMDPYRPVSSPDFSPCSEGLSGMFSLMVISHYQETNRGRKSYSGKLKFTPIVTVFSEQRRVSNGPRWWNSKSKYFYKSSSP